MTVDGNSFSPLQRVLHWLMAIMVLVMLFIGVTMVSIRWYSLALFICRESYPPTIRFTRYCEPHTPCSHTCSLQRSYCTSLPRCSTP